MDRLPTEAILDIGSIPPAGDMRSECIASNRIICERLNEIGIQCVNVPGAVGFLPGIEIRDGRILADIEIALPASLLHEAAHIALMTPTRRRQAGDDINGVYARMRADARAAGWHHRGVRYGAMVAAGEDRAAYALAWAWGKAWNLPANMVMFSGGSYGLSRSELQTSLEDCSFAGVRFLEIAQLVTPGAYPRLEKMAQEIDPPQSNGLGDQGYSNLSGLKFTLAAVGFRLLRAISA